MPRLSEEPNLQSLWGRLAVEELSRLGVRCFVVCPGSRSTPLARAVARLESSDLLKALWVDERGAGYFALGTARASALPAAVITTSGTAVANLLPAVVEAALDGVPLLLLTADRPPELRAAGANQSIDQVGLLASHLRWHFDLPVPTPETPLRSLLTTIDQAFARATGEDPGPVQVNCPFREPLAPEKTPIDGADLADLGRWEADPSRPFTETGARITVPAPTTDLWQEAIASRAPGLLVAAGLSRPRDASPILALAEALGWPVHADVRSSIRLGPGHPLLFPHLDRLLGTALRPRSVIQFGARPLSRRLARWLEAGDFDHYVVADAARRRLDPHHRSTLRIEGPALAIAGGLAQALRQSGHAPCEPDAGLAEAHGRVEEALARAVQDGSEPSEPWVARTVTALLEEGDGLFLSSSMPIRDVQSYGVAGGAALAVTANRGASGIDGVLSSAAGFAAARARPTTALVGDQAFLHDLSALPSLARLDPALVLVVLNNGGGSIFSFLPVAAHPDVITPWLDAPHAHEFEGVARAFGLPYRRATTRPEFLDAFRVARATGRCAIVEVRSALDRNRADHDRIEAAIGRAMEASGP